MVVPVNSALGEVDVRRHPVPFRKRELIEGKEQVGKEASRRVIHPDTQHEMAVVAIAQALPPSCRTQLIHVSAHARSRLPLRTGHPLAALPWSRRIWKGNDRRLLWQAGRPRREPWAHSACDCCCACGPEMPRSVVTRRHTNRRAFASAAVCRSLRRRKRSACRCACVRSVVVVIPNCMPALISRSKTPISRDDVNAAAARSEGDDSCKAVGAAEQGGPRGFRHGLGEKDRCTSLKGALFIGSTSGSPSRMCQASSRPRPAIFPLSLQ
eukprot:6176802-Pleurochrysis_carterae.AAC.3